eukprot:12939158-Prorocentrum_lima.AAC.1
MLTSSTSRSSGLSTNKWYATPGKDCCAMVKHDAKVGAPGANQVLFCNPDRNGLEWIFRLIKTFDVEW